MKSENPRAVSECDELLRSFKDMSNQSPIPQEQCSQLLAQLKLLMIQLPSLSPSALQPCKAEFMVKREILENAAFYEINLGNVSNFDRYMVQLKDFYYEIANIPDFPKSEKKYPLLGLYLLSLIYQNKTAEYHTELECLTWEEQTNMYISVPLGIEQSIMDGQYYKVLHTTRNVPLPQYNFFLDKLIHTVRKEAARSAEKAYSTLDVKDAVELFMLSNPQELQKFADAELENAKENNMVWLIHNDKLHFQTTGEEKLSIPAHRMMDQSMLYAIELEKIV